MEDSYWTRRHGPHRGDEGRPHGVDAVAQGQLEGPQGDPAPQQHVGPHLPRVREGRPGPGGRGGHLGREGRGGGGGTCLAALLAAAAAGVRPRPWVAAAGLGGLGGEVSVAQAGPAAGLSRDVGGAEAVLGGTSRPTCLMCSIHQIKYIKLEIENEQGRLSREREETKSRR